MSGTGIFKYEGFHVGKIENSMTQKADRPHVKLPKQRAPKHREHKPMADSSSDDSGDEGAKHGVPLASRLLREQQAKRTANGDLPERLSRHSGPIPTSSSEDEGGEEGGLDAARTQAAEGGGGSAPKHRPTDSNSTGSSSSSICAGGSFGSRVASQARPSSLAALVPKVKTNAAAAANTRATVPPSQKKQSAKAKMKAAASAKGQQKLAFAAPLAPGDAVELVAVRSGGPGDSSSTVHRGSGGSLSTDALLQRKLARQQAAAAAQAGLEAVIPTLGAGAASVLESLVAEEGGGDGGHNSDSSDTDSDIDGGDDLEVHPVDVWYGGCRLLSSMRPFARDAYRRSMLSTCSERTQR
jgi:hypothetical protein